MIVSKLLSLVDAMYPNTSTTEQKIEFFNMAQDAISPYFGVIVEDSTLFTVVSQDSYTYPTGLNDISQIITVMVENDGSGTAADDDLIVTSADMKVGAYTIAAQPTATCLISFTHTLTSTVDTLGTIALVGTDRNGTAQSETITPINSTTVWSTKYYKTITSITGSGWVVDTGADKIKVGVSAIPSDRYDYTEYRRSQDYQNPQSSYGYYQIINSLGAKKLALYPIPDTARLNIVIRYKKALTDLSASSLASEPEFDSRFHDLLAVYCCHMICSIGASPDAFQADMFMQKFESGINNLWKFKMEEETKQKHKRRDNSQWHKARTINMGY